MSQTKHVKLLAALAAATLISNSVVAQDERPRSPQQPGAQPGIQAPREGQRPRENTGQRRESQPGDQRIGRQASNAELDRHLATWFAAENEAQVMLSRQVAENAESEEVKQFAQQMVEHHQQIMQRLREVVQAGASEQPSRQAPTGQEQLNREQLNREQLNRDQLNRDQLNRDQLNPEQPTRGQTTRPSLPSGLTDQERPRAELPVQEEPTPGLPIEERPFPGVPGQDEPPPEVAGQAQPRAAQTLPGQARPGQPGQQQRDNIGQPGQQPARQGQTAGGELNQSRDGNAMVAWQLTAIKRELCQKNLQSAMEELQDKRGTEFDQCYMQLQVYSHQGMVNTIEIFQRYASDDLQGVLQEVGPKVESHLEEAKELVKKIDSNGAKDEG